MSPERHRVVDGNTQIEQGTAIEFKNFLYETEDKKEIKFIKGHRTFGVKIIVLKSEKEQEDELLKKADEVKAKREGANAHEVEAKAKAKAKANAAKKKKAEAVKKKKEEETKANQSN